MHPSETIPCNCFTACRFVFAEMISLWNTHLNADVSPSTCPSNNSFNTFLPHLNKLYWTNILKHTWGDIRVVLFCLFLCVFACFSLMLLG